MANQKGKQEEVISRRSKDTYGKRKDFLDRYTSALMGVSGR